jgi:serine/threonine protein kinase
VFSAAVACRFDADRQFSQTHEVSQMMTTPANPLPPGAKLGQFVICGALGAGGMGEVYDAEDVRLHRHVALKVVRREVASDPVRRARLEREASAVAMLNHPHIVTVHSLEEHEGVLFITMELIDGSTLASAQPAGGFPLDRMLPLSIQLVDAIAAAHGLGIVHRDLKPANIMITHEGAIKVLDFGLSRVAVEQQEGTATPDALTIDGHLVGTAPYMSPEQVEGHTADERSDLFSLGVVLFEMATGQRPFTGRTSLAILTSIGKDTPPLASVLNARVPEELARIIDRCLVKDPARRMQSAVDLRGQLEDLMRTLESRAWVVRPSRGSRWRKRGLTAAATQGMGRWTWRWRATSKASSRSCVVTGRAESWERPTMPRASVPPASLRRSNTPACETSALKRCVWPSIQSTM